MDINDWLEKAAKWVLPILGILFIAKYILGLNFSFGFSF